MTVIRDLSLRIVIDDETLDLGAACESPPRPGPPCQLLFPAPESFANGVSVEIQPAWLERLANARVVTGTVLGFPVVLSSDDLSAISKFAQAIHRKVASKQ
jgi:hypothetical protein